MEKRIIIGLLLLLTGCASTNQLADTGNISNWEMKAKLAIVYPPKNCPTENCRAQSEQGKIDWKQQGSQITFSVYDPFGKELFSFVGNDKQGQAVAEGQEQYISDVKGFFTERLKMDIEPSSFRHWLIGRVDPAFPVESKDKDSFQQNGFKIEVRYWREEPIGNVPTLVIIKKGDYTIRVVIREWLS